MTVAVESALTHDADPGDGIHAFVINSKQGVVAEQQIHKQSVVRNHDRLCVQKNETIDFVVDRGEGLNNDQFLWDITIREQEVGDRAIVWNSRDDFTGFALRPLTSWEQLAQVLLCGNEFLFVD